MYFRIPYLGRETLRRTRDVLEDVGRRILISRVLVNLNHLEHRVAGYHKLLLPARECTANRGTLRHPDHDLTLGRGFHDGVLEARADEPAIHEVIARLKLGIHVEVSIAEYDHVFRCVVPLGERSTE